jgi:hypothetical protein
MSVSLLIAVLTLAAGQLEPGPVEKTQSAARLTFMQETAASIQIHVEETEGAELELQPQPIMRWGSALFGSAESGDRL